MGFGIWMYVVANLKKGPNNVLVPEVLCHQDNAIKRKMVLFIEKDHSSEACILVDDTGSTVTSSCKKVLQQNIKSLHQGLLYVNTMNDFLEDNRVEQRLSKDFIQPNERGAQVWACLEWPWAHNALAE